MTDTTAQRVALIAGLRELATFYETHPDMPLPSAEFTHCVLSDDDAAGAAAVKRIAGQLGVLAVADDGGIEAERRFGGLALRAFYVSRQRMADWHALTSYSGAVRADKTAVGRDTPADASGEGVSSMAPVGAAAAPSAVGAGEGTAADGVTPCWRDEVTGLVGGGLVTDDDPERHRHGRHGPGPRQRADAEDPR